MSGRRNHEESKLESSQNRQEHKREFEEIIIEHLDSLYNIALRMTRNRADAEDLVQDVCTRAYRFFYSFRKGSNAKAWLLTILRNIYINDFRKKAKRPPVVSLSNIEPLEDCSIRERTSAFAHSVNDKALEQLSSESIKAIIDELPDEFKMVVILFYVEELSYQEIANIVACPKGTVMSRLYRARKQLRKQLSAYAGNKGYGKDQKL